MVKAIDSIHHAVSKAQKASSLQPRRATSLAKKSVGFSFFLSPLILRFLQVSYLFPLRP
jgi:hypothetical protein